jgi:hypothetical protein
VIQNWDEKAPSDTEASTSEDAKIAATSNKNNPEVKA